MTAHDFVASRSDDWRQLEQWAQAGTRNGDERRRFAALYRVALVDLGQLRTLAAREGRAGGPVVPALAWLNGVVSRAHAQVALRRRSSPVDLRRFYGQTFPQAFRRALPRVALAAGLLLASALVGYLLCHGDVEIAKLLAGPAMSRNAEAFSHLGQGRDETTDSVMAAFYVTNNVRVSFIAFALGITAGVGTLLVLMQNGFILGVTLVLVRHLGATAGFFGFIASHGLIELGAIVIAAAAGLGLGRAIVAPGPHTRLDALKVAGRQAAPLVLGAASLLMVAAFFEGFVSPSSLSLRTKAIIGAANAAWLITYLARAGRAPGTSDVTSELSD